MGRQSRTYTCWCNMRARCENPRNSSYANYGARGITVCKRWRKFSNFLADMGEAPIGLTLDRRNNNRGYSKTNCHWITRGEQQRNRRSNRLLTYKGRTMHADSWAAVLGIAKSTLSCRLNSRGWSVERALTTSADGQKKFLTYAGQTQHISEWARQLGVSPSTISMRLARGWSVGRTLSTRSQEDA